MKKAITRTQTGVRIETSTLKVLKGLAEYLDMSLSDLLEGVVWHALEGKSPFSADTLEKIEQLKVVYDLDFAAADSHSIPEGRP